MTPLARVSLAEAAIVLRSVGIVETSPSPSSSWDTGGPLVMNEKSEGRLVPVVTGNPSFRVRGQEVKVGQSEGG